MGNEPEVFELFIDEITGADTHTHHANGSEVDADALTRNIKLAFETMHKRVGEVGKKPWQLGEFHLGFERDDKPVFDVERKDNDVKSKISINISDKTFNKEDAVNALHYIYTHYGKEIAGIIEKMYRNETNHFKSAQYMHTGTGGMEVGKKNTAPAPYYGWDPDFFKIHPQYLPVGTWSAYEGKGLSGHGGNKQIKNRPKVFVVMPSVEAGMVFKAEYIKKYGGNWARWNSTDPATQDVYRKAISPIKAKIVDSFH